MNKILIIAGGTGGHIFPALAVADALADRDVEVHWLGSNRGLERQLIAHRYPITYLSIKGIRGKNIFKKLLVSVQLLKAVFQVLRLMRKIRPNMVLGMGGYVSGPGCFAAWVLRIPLVIHEQNSIAGFTNRMLAKFADEILEAFPRSFPSSIHAKTIGNPLRQSITNIENPKQRNIGRRDQLRILVLGGSQGARVINKVMVNTFKEFSEKHKLAIWHQTGKKDFETVKNEYLALAQQNKTQENKVEENKVEAFIDDVEKAYAWADLIICRSGALTVSEIAAVGVASVLVPYPYAVDDHQWYNGRYLEEAGAAILIRQVQLNSNRLTEILSDYLKNPGKLLWMAEAARNQAKPDALQQAVAACVTHGQFSNG